MFEIRIFLKFVPDAPQQAASLAVSMVHKTGENRSVFTVYRKTNLAQF
jgi:hypothetical protein